MDSQGDQRPLRIVQVSTCDLGGGAEKVAFTLHQLYRQMGHRSTLVVGDKRSDDPDVLAIDNYRRGRSILNSLWFRAERWLGWQDLQRPGSHRIPLLVGQPWDVLHLHNLHGAYFDLGALPALSRLAPTVMMLHDAWMLTGHCAHHFSCGRWRTGCGRCPDLTIHPAVRRDGTRFNWRRKQRLIAASRLWVTAPSQWLLDEVRQSPILSAKPARLIRNGVDLEVFQPGPKAAARVELGLPLDRPIVVFCGTNALLSRFKDGLTLLKALVQLVEHIPGVCLVALGSRELPEGFRHLAGAVEFRDPEPDPRKVAGYYRAADVVAHPARAETAPLVPIEAMACGRAVVASAVGGIPEYLEDGKNGLLVPPENPPALAEALCRALQEQPLAAELGECALQTARERFNVIDQAKNYLAWYHELMTETRRKEGKP